MRSSRIFSSFGKEEARKQRRVVEFSEGVFAALYDGSFFTNDVRAALKKADGKYNKTKNALIVNVSPHGQSQHEKWVQSVLPGLLVTKPAFLGPYYGTPSLSSLFETCAQIYEWLRAGHDAGEQRVVIITAHMQSDPDYRPLAAVALVAACYMTYIGLFEDGIKALDVFRGQARGGRMVADARLTRDTNLPNLHQYLRLFAGLRVDKCFPPFRPKSIVNILAQGRVTCGGKDWNPVLRIYHAAVGNYAAHITTVPVKSETLTREGLASFAVGDLFVGDVVLSFENQVDGHSFTEPLFSIARHVAFITSPAARVLAADIELAPGMEKHVKLHEDFSVDIFCEDRTLSSHVGGKELLDNFAVECMLVEELAHNAPTGPPVRNAEPAESRWGTGRRDSDVRRKELLEEVLGMEVNTITANDFLDAFKNYAASSGDAEPVGRRKSITLVEPTDPLEISAPFVTNFDMTRPRGGSGSLPADESDGQLDDYSDLDEVVTMTSTDSWAGGAKGTVLERKAHGGSAVYLADSDEEDDAHGASGEDGGPTDARPPKVEKSESRIALHQITDALNEFVTELQEEPEAWSMNGLFNRVSGILQAAPDKRVSQDIMAAVGPVVSGPPRANTMPVRRPPKVEKTTTTTTPVPTGSSVDRSMSIPTASDPAMSNDSAASQPAPAPAATNGSSGELPGGPFSLVTVSHSPPPRHGRSAGETMVTDEVVEEEVVEGEMAPSPLPTVSEQKVYEEEEEEETMGVTAPMEAAMVAAFSPAASRTNMHAPPASPPSAPPTPLKADDNLREDTSNNMLVSPLVAKWSNAAAAERRAPPPGLDALARSAHPAGLRNAAPISMDRLAHSPASAPVAAERSVSPVVLRNAAIISMDRLAPSPSLPTALPVPPGLRNAAPISMERLAHTPRAQKSTSVESDSASAASPARETTATDRGGESFYSPVLQATPSPSVVEQGSVRLSVVETEAPVGAARSVASPPVREACSPVIEAPAAAVRSNPRRVASPAVETAGLIASVRRATSPAPAREERRPQPVREERPPLAREDSAPIAWESLVPLSVLETSVPVASNAPLLSTSPPVHLPSAPAPPKAPASSARSVQPEIEVESDETDDDTDDTASSSGEDASETSEDDEEPQFMQSVWPSSTHLVPRARAPSMSMPDAPRRPSMSLPDAPRPRTNSMTTAAPRRDVPRPRTMSMTTAAPPREVPRPRTNSMTAQMPRSRTPSMSKVAPFSRARTASLSKNPPVANRSFLSPAPARAAGASPPVAETSSSTKPVAASARTDASASSSVPLGTSPTRSFLSQTPTLPIPPLPSARKVSPPKPSKKPSPSSKGVSKRTPSTAPPRPVPAAHPKAPSTAPPRLVPPTKPIRPASKQGRPVVPSTAPPRLVPSTAPPRLAPAAPPPRLVPSTAPPRPAVAPAPVRTVPKPARSVPGSPGRSRRVPVPAAPVRSVPVSPTPKRLSASPPPARASPTPACASPKPTRMTLTRSVPSPVLSGSVIARVRAMSAVDEMVDQSPSGMPEEDNSSFSRSPSLPTLSPSATRLVPRNSANAASRAVALAEEVLGNEFAASSAGPVVQDEFANSDSLSVNSFAELSPSATHAVPRGSGGANTQSDPATSEVLLCEELASRSPSTMKTRSPSKTGRRSPSLMALSPGATRAVPRMAKSAGKQQDVLAGEISGGLSGPESIKEMSGPAAGLHAAVCKRLRFAENVVELGGNSARASDATTVDGEPKKAGAASEFAEKNTVCAVAGAQVEINPLATLAGLGSDRKSTAIGSPRKSTVMGEHRKSIAAPPGVQLVKSRSESGAKLGKKHSDFAERMKKLTRSKSKAEGVDNNAGGRPKLSKAERKEAKAKARAEAKLLRVGAKEAKVPADEKPADEKPADESADEKVGGALVQAFSDPLTQAATMTAESKLKRKLTEPRDFAMSPDASEEGSSEDASPVKAKKGVKGQLGNGAAWIIRRMTRKSKR